MEPVSKIAFFEAQAGKESQLGDALLALVAPTRKEGGSRRYEIFQSADDTRQWVVLEDWTSSSAFEFHMNTPYVKAFMANVPSLCEGTPEIRTFIKRSNTDER